MRPLRRLDLIPPHYQWSRSGPRVGLVPVRVLVVVLVVVVVVVPPPVVVLPRVVVVVVVVRDRFGQLLTVQSLADAALVAVADPHAAVFGTQTFAPQQVSVTQVSLPAVQSPCPPGHVLAGQAVLLLMQKVDPAAVGAQTQLGNGQEA